MDLYRLVIITQTVGQMTENTPSNTIATQTPLPRTYLSFAALATNKSDYTTSPFEKQMLENELLLQTQRNALKTVDLKLNANHTNDRDANGALNYFQEDDNSHGVQGSSTQHHKVDKIAKKMV